MWLLLGCSASLTLGADTALLDADPREDGPEVIAGNEDAVIDTGDRVEPDFFDDTVIHTVDITLSDDAVRDLSSDPYEYVQGAVVVDGDDFARVGVRLRGKIGSFRTLRGKPKFKIDFDLYDDDQRLGTYQALALNNEVVDCGYTREPIGYAFLRAIGRPAPRTAYTRVTVNGDDYGLYVAVEYPDDQFLEARYDAPDGNLYDGKYLYNPSTGGYQLIDFTSSEQDNFQLEEGEDVGLADIRAVTDAIGAAGTFDERLGPVLDLDAFHAHIAAEQWLGHIDGYTTNTNNYRVYFDPSDGGAELIVTDLDYAFLDAASWGMSWGSPSGALVAACWADAACVARHGEVVGEVLAATDTDALLALYDANVALIEADAASDPRRECASGDIAGTQAYVRAWVAGASASLGAYWGR